MTLNEIAQSFISSIGKDFDYTLREEVKFSIKHWRAKLIRQEFERSGTDDKLKQKFVMALEKVDQADSCVVSTNCEVNRTTGKVPAPVTLKTPNSFGYVGPAKYWNKFDVLPYVQASITELMTAAHTRFLKRIVKYHYVNGYLYIYGSCLSKYIQIEGYFENPEEAVEVCVDSANCVSDDDPFPIGAHMLDTILTGLRTKELALLTPKLDTDIQIQPPAQ